MTANQISKFLSECRYEKFANKHLRLGQIVYDKLFDHQNEILEELGYNIYYEESDKIVEESVWKLIEPDYR